MAEQLDSQATAVSPVSVQEFSKKVKEKYPEYKDVDDATLAKKIVEKYPEYKERVSFDQPEPVPTGPQAGTEPVRQESPQPTQPEKPTYMQQQLRENGMLPKDKLPEGYSPLNDNSKNPVVAKQTITEKPIFSEEQKQWANEHPTLNSIFSLPGMGIFKEAYIGTKKAIGGLGTTLDVIASNISNSIAGGAQIDEQGNITYPWEKGYKQDKSEFYNSVRKFEEETPASSGGTTAFLGQLLPQTAALAATVLMRSPTATKAYLASMYGSSFGNGVETYDDYIKETGKQENPTDRYLVGMGYGAAEYIGEKVGLDYFMPKGYGKLVAKSLDASPSMAKEIGKSVLENYAKLTKQPLSAILKKIAIGSQVEGGQEVATELMDIAIDKWLTGKDVTGQEIRDRLLQSYGGGALMGSGIAPFAHISQNAATTQRRRDQGKVTVSIDEEGLPLELIQTKDKIIGIRPDGEEVKNISKSTIDKAQTLKTEDFEKAISQYKKTGSITTAIINGQQYTINNPEDLGVKGKPIFAKDAEGNIIPVPNHKVENPVTQTLDEIDQANQQEAERVKLYEGILDPNAQVINEVEDNGARFIDFSNGQTKIIFNGQEVIANDVNEKYRILESIVKDNQLPEPKATETGEVISPAPEKKVVTQKFGNTSIDIIENEGYDEVVPSEKVPLEKALPALEKKFENNPKFELKVERVQVEEPGETKYDDPVKKTVIKSIRIVPKVAQNANIEDQNVEKVSETQQQLADQQNVENIQSVESSQNNQLLNEEPENVDRQVSGTAQQTENTPQAQQGQGNEKGLEENVGVANQPIDTKRSNEIKRKIKLLRNEDGIVSDENMETFRELKRELELLPLETSFDVEQRIKNQSSKLTIDAERDNRNGLSFGMKSAFATALRNDGYSKEDIDYIIGDGTSWKNIAKRYDFINDKNKNNIDVAVPPVATISQTPGDSAKPKKSKSISKVQQQAYKIEVNPTSARDLALQYFINGGTINKNALETLYGNKMVGNPAVESERKARFTWVKKDGLSIDEIAHSLWEQNSHIEGNSLETSDFRDAIEDVIRSYTSPVQMAKDLVLAYDPNKQQFSDEQLDEMELNSKFEQPLDETDVQPDEISDDIKDAIWEVSGYYDLTPEETQELNNLFNDNATEKEVNTEGKGTVDTGSPEPETKEGTSTSKNAKELTPLEKEIQSLQSERNELLKKKGKTLSNANERNGLFGDIAAQPNDLFAGQGFDTNEAQRIVKSIDDRIYVIDQTIEDLTVKNDQVKATAEKENAGQQELVIPEKEGSLLNISEKAAQDIEGRTNLIKTLDKISSELGEPVNIINSEEIPPSVDQMLKKVVKDKNDLSAFFFNDQVYILSDKIKSVSDAVSSYVHETIIHKGLRNTFAQADRTSIIGKQYAKLDDLFIDVFGSMSRSQKMQIANSYAPGLYENGKIMRNPTNEEKSLIGEEFLAHVSENPEIYNAPVLSKWQEWINRLAQIIRKAFRLTSNQFSQNDLLDIIREQRRRMREQGKKDVSNEIRLKVSDNPEENNLIAVHNIKPAGLLNANRLGGLPMPSLAIVDINNGFDKYGDITLIADKDFIDPKKNRHSKVFASDVYSARYPNINYQIPRSGENKIVNKVNSLFDDKSLASDISHHIKSEIEDGGLRSLSRDQYAQLLFLADTKQPVEIKYSESKVSDDVKQAFKDNGWLGLMYHEIHENNEVKKQLTDLYMKKYESDPDLMNIAIERFVDEDGMLNSNLLRNFIRDVQDDIQKTGKVDTYSTVRAADDYIRNNNLQDEFEAYAANLYDQIGVEEKIFRGYSNSGNRLYSPHTLENVLKEMKKDGIRGGEKFGYGAGSVRAMVSPEFKSLPEIQKNRGRILPFEDDIKSSANDELIEVLDNLKKFYKYESGSFGYYDNASEELVQLARSGRSESFKPIDEESRKMVADFLNKLANMPTEYFEAKINRGVSLAEFKNALIPSNTSPEIRDILKFNGINTVEYKDNSERAERLKQLADEKELRFRIIGETGAANLDKAEEATTRLDNLAIAREMERAGKDVKSIRLATGWEKGVDGKWRYEVPDGKLKQDKFPFEELQSFDTKGRLIFTDHAPRKYKLSEIIDDPELFKAYPELEDLHVEFNNSNIKANGAYVNNSEGLLPKGIYLNNLDLVNENKDWNDDFTKKYLIATDDTKSTLVHEIQHAIQDIEGFAQGGNIQIGKELGEEGTRYVNALTIARTIDSYYKSGEYNTYGEAKQQAIDDLEELMNEKYDKKTIELSGLKIEVLRERAEKLPNFDKINESARSIYRRLAGEVESRNVQTRMNMTPEERLNTLLSETEDVSREDQIVIFDGLGINNMSEQNKPFKEIFQERHLAIQDLEDSGVKRLKVNSDGTVSVYHGTSSINWEKIQKEGFKEGSFFSVSKSGTEYGDSPLDVAKRKFGKDGIVVEVRIDPRDLSSAAAGSELYSEKSLVPKDGHFESQIVLMDGLGVSNLEDLSLGENKPMEYLKSKDVETGKPVTMTYLKNTEKAPYLGSRFGQDVEPSGFYFIQKEHEFPPSKGWIEGQITLNNPLVIPITDETMISYKNDLSKKYGGKKNKALTNAIKKDGYDGIITTRDGYLGEMIKFDFDPSKQAEEPITDKIEQQRLEVNTEPSEAQKEAGNYKMGHVRFDGFDISIENPKGSVRSGVDKQGNEWSQTLPADYGYFRGTVGKDKDHVDVFIGNKPESSNIYVIDQIDPNTGKFDEHKVMLGFDSQAKAKQTYLAAFEPGWKGLGQITKTDKQGLKEWFEKGDQKKPFSDNVVRFRILGDPRSGLTNIRGSWTKAKIIKELKEIKKTNTSYGKFGLLKGIASFENAQDLRNHLFYHGTGGGVSGALYPSITMSEREAERNGGGGYGQRYFAISVSKSKRKAASFSGQSRSISVYPVILNKEANVIDRPDLNDSNELDDIIEELWNDKVDAVRLGDWSDPHSEQELAVINPNAISTWSGSDSRMVYGMNLADFNEKTDEELENIIDKAKSALIKMAEWEENNKRPVMPEMIEYNLNDPHETVAEAQAKNKQIISERKRIREEYNQLKQAEQRKLADNIRFRIQPRDERFDQLREDLNKITSLARSEERLKELEESKIGKKVAERQAIIKQISGYKQGYKAGANEKRFTLYVIQRYITKYANENINYDEATKGEIQQLLTAMQNANTPAKIAKAFERIDELASKGIKRKLINKIAKLLKNIAPKLQSGKPVGNISPEAYQALNKIQKIIEMSQEEYDQYLEEIPDGDVESMALASMFGNLKEKSIDNLFEALKSATSIKKDGKLWYKEKIDELKKKHEKLINKAVDDITGGKGIQSSQQIRSDKGIVDKNSSFKEYLSKNLSFEWLLDLISNNKKDRTGYGFMQDHFGDLVNKSENEESKGIRDTLELINEKAFEIFGKEKSALAKIFSKNSKVVKKSGVTYATNDGRKEIPLSQNEAYKRWMEMNDPTLTPTFEKMGWDAQSLEELENFIDPKVMKWAQWQINEFFPKYYERVNNIYKEMYFADLPFNPNYSGYLKREKTSVGDKEDSMLRPSTLIQSVANSSLKSRIKNTRDIMLQDGDSALARHIAEMEHFIAWAESIREIRAVLSSDVVQDAIKKEHGNNIRTVLNERINSLVRGGVDRGEVNYLVDWIRKNYVTSALGINVSLIPKQMTAMFSYLNDISIMDYIKGASEFIANPTKAIEALNDSEFIKRRYEKGWTHEIVAAMKRDIPNTLAGTKSKVNAVRDALMLPIMLGDKFAVYSGYTVYSKFYKEYKANNPLATHKEAHDFAINKFERIAKRTQQSSDVTDTSRFQETSLGKVFMMFKNQQQQYFRYEMAAINSLIKGKGSKTENAKIILLTHVVLPVIFQMVDNWFTDEDDDKERLRLLRAALLGPLDGLMIAGDIIGYGLERLMGEKWSYSASPMFDTVQDLGGSIDNMIKYLNEPYPEKEAEDLQKALDFAIQFTSSTTTGIPYEPAKRVYNKITGSEKDKRTEEQASEIIRNADEFRKFVKEAAKRNDREAYDLFTKDKNITSSVSIISKYDSRIQKLKKGIKHYDFIKDQKKVDELEKLLDQTYKELIEKYKDLDFPKYKLNK